MASDDLQSKAADLVRKILTVGVGAVFLTEESVRALISEFKLPKELLGGVLEGANKTKNEFLGRLSSEIMEKISGKLDPQELMSEFLEKHEVEFQVKMSFKPKKSGSKSEEGSG